MFFLAYIVLPLLILGNLVMLGMNLSKNKLHPVSALLCVAIPIAVFIIHWKFFPEKRQEGLIVFVRYPKYIMIQTALNAIILLFLRYNFNYDQNPRRNYYRDAETPPKLTDNQEANLLDD